MDETTSWSPRTPSCILLIVDEPDDRPTVRLDGQADDAAAGTPLFAGDRVGRYAVERELGRGGMGIVYAARDPELGRTVAIKLLHPDRRVADGAEARAHLLAEARVLAQLNDPHIVQIFDVGAFDDGVYLAMELVVGQNLAQWLRHRPASSTGGRALDEVLPVFVAAGKGLAAAHRHGVVHRDFKPSNVLLGDDGRVRVVDFGLATADAGGGATTTSAKSSEVSVRGTLGYMPPEHQRGEATDARGDQYSFCVALHVGLAGSPPPIASGGGITVLGPPQIPTAIGTVLARGLRHDPAERWPSMDALLVALQPRARSRAAAAAIVATLGVGGVAAAYVLLGPAALACRDAHEQIGVVWNASVADELRGAFMATQLSYADAAATRVVSTLDGWASEWTAAYSDACPAARAPPAEGAGRIDCLVGSHDDLRALVAVLRDADAATVERSVSAVMALRNPGECEGDADSSTPPANLRADVERVRAQLRTTRALLDAGHNTEALAMAQAAVPEADALGWEPLRAESVATLARAEDATGAAEAARTSHEQAYWIAHACGEDALARESAIALVYVLGNTLLRDDEAQHWAREAEAAIARTPTTAREKADLLNNIGAMHERAARFAEARAALASALEIREAVLPAEHPEIASTYNSLGIVELRVGTGAAARKHFERAIEIARHVHGDAHPRVALYLTNLASVYLDADDPEGARPVLEEALEIRQTALGADHPLVALTMHNLGIAADLAGDHQQALVRMTEALALRERSLGPDHPDVADSHNSLGVVYAALNRNREAREHQQLALRLFEHRLGADHPSIIMVHLNLGELARKDREWSASLEHFGRAVAIVELVHGATSPRLLSGLEGVARAQLELGHRARCLAAAARARPIAEAAKDVESLAEIDGLIAAAGAPPHAAER